MLMTILLMLLILPSEINISDNFLQLLDYTAEDLRLAGYTKHSYLKSRASMREAISSLRVSVSFQIINTTIINAGHVRKYKVPETKFLYTFIDIDYAYLFGWKEDRCRCLSKVCSI